MTNFWRTLILLAIVAGIVMMAVGPQVVRIIGGIIILVNIVAVQTIIQIEEQK